MTKAIVPPEVPNELPTVPNQTPETINQTEADSEKQAHDELGLVQRKTAVETKAAMGEIVNQAVEKTAKLMVTLENRFKKINKNHENAEGLKWKKVQKKLEEASPGKIRSLQHMEDTGGEPDVVCFDIETGEFVFMDCSRESPIGRRNLVYDQQAAEIRMSIYQTEKRFDNAVGMAASMGINLLTSEEYKWLQTIYPGRLDSRSENWLKTTVNLRGRVLTGVAGIVSSTFAINHDKDLGFRGSLKI